MLQAKSIALLPLRLLEKMRDALHQSMCVDKGMKAALFPAMQKDH